MQYTIVLDAGHGGNNPGAVYHGRRESDDALRLALAVGDILRDDGYDVIYTRDSDITQSVTEKADLANDANGDLFISFHRNASEDPNEYDGTQTLIYGPGGVRELLAENLNQQLEQVGFQNLGTEFRPNLVVLNRTRMPAVLVEAGFINSDRDNEIFDQQFQEMAQAIADGIVETIDETMENRDSFYTIQVGAFRNKIYADQLLLRLKRQGYDAYLVQEEGLYKVRVGTYENLDQAAEMEQRLKIRGYNTFLTTESS